MGALCAMVHHSEQQKRHAEQQSRRSNALWDARVVIHYCPRFGEVSYDFPVTPVFRLKAPPFFIAQEDGQLRLIDGEGNIICEIGVTAGDWIYQQTKKCVQPDELLVINHYLVPQDCTTIAKLREGIHIS